MEAVVRAGRRRSSTGSETGPGLELSGVPLPVDYPGPEPGDPGPGAGGARRHKHNLRQRYELRETLGRGTYGKVKKARDRHTGRLVAIKSIRKDKVPDQEEMVHIRREIEVMSALKHPHIICIYEVFENREKLVIVMEYASRGELYEYVSERRRLTDRETRRFFRQIVSAVHHCHKNGVVHRDLKLENVLLDENCNIKIADFGLSNLYHKDHLLSTFCGSPLYASPEIVNGRPYHGPEVDSWALGVLLYTLVYGTMPFDGTDHIKLIHQISTGQYKEPSQNSDARGLIRWMLMVNPDRRATIEDIANHWWINWGWATPVCDCPDQENPGSPAGHRLLPPAAPPAGRPRLRAGEGGASGLKRRGILKPSVPDQRSQSLGELELRLSLGSQEGGGSFSPAQRGGAEEEDEDEDEDEEVCLGGSPAKMTPSVPLRGILKNSSHLSPEGTEAPQPPGGSCAPLHPPPSSPTRRTMGKKGILKRNGKFSLCAPSRDSRPPSAPRLAAAPGLSLTSTSFRGLAWPPGPPAPKVRASVSAEDLLPPAGPGGLLGGPGGRSHARGMPPSPGENESFSLLELDDVTQIYQTALQTRRLP